MALEDDIWRFIQECEEKTDEYLHKSERAAARGEDAKAQTFGDWAFIYYIVSFRLRHLMRLAKMRGGT